MKALLWGLGASAVLGAGVAWAEVCDKVVEGWPGVGRFDAFQEAGLTLANPVLLAVLAAPLCFIWIGWRRTAVLAGACSLVVAFWITTYGPDDWRIFRAAVREGCLEGPPWGMIALFVVAGLTPGVLFVVQDWSKRPN